MRRPMLNATVQHSLIVVEPCKKGSSDFAEFKANLFAHRLSEILKVWYCSIPNFETFSLSLSLSQFSELFGRVSVDRCEDNQSDMPRKESNHIKKLIVGVDYGTTYSGEAPLSEPSNFQA